MDEVRRELLLEHGLGVELVLWLVEVWDYLAVGLAELLFVLWLELLLVRVRGLSKVRP
jgi:hypothetical protein